MDPGVHVQMSSPVPRPAVKPLKVTMLVSSYPRRSDDSASIFLRNLAESLRDHGVVVHVLAPADGKAGTTSENGVTVQRFRYFPGPWQKLAYGSGVLPNLRRNPLLWLQVPFFVACMVISLFRSVRKIRPDVIHAHWVIPQGCVAVLAKMAYKTPAIITLHGGDAFSLTARLLQKLKRFALRRSDAWTTNTRTTASAVVSGDPVLQPLVIPMGVDVDHFASGKREQLRARIPQDTQVVLFVGRLVEKKGVEDLITAFSLLPDRPRTLLWIVGDGELKTELEALAEQKGIAQQTIFWGRMPNDQLPDFYAAADLFVGPSVVAASGDTEGQGVVFLEAMAAGLCVLATKAGGISEVVEDGRTGILVEPRNPRQLADTMVKLLTDKRRRCALASNALEKVKNTYSWSKIAMQFDDLYRSVLANHRRLSERSSHTQNLR
jgi:glycosyltransferase involved in cell wall biosynthesis